MWLCITYANAWKESEIVQPSEPRFDVSLGTGLRDLRPEGIFIGRVQPCSNLAIKSCHLCCLQETEIQVGFPENLLNCNSYNVELEMNTVKKSWNLYKKRHKVLQKKRFRENWNAHCNY